jgi:hypothetical protein
VKGSWPRRARRLSGDLFARLAQGHIWMPTIYPKNVAENIPAHILRQIRKEIDHA